MSETTLIPNNVELAKPLGSPTTVETLLGKYRKSFEIAAPQHLDVNRVMQVALMTVSRSPYLLECTASSLLASFMVSVQLGLDIGAKECHLVPFKNKAGIKEVQLVPDYRGVLKLIRNSGMVCGARARTVYNQDFFELEEGTQPTLRHKPNFNHARDPKDIIGFYSIVDFCNDQQVPTGYCDMHFLPRMHIDKVREKSPAKDNGPWVTHYDEMGMKTCLKHHAKTLPYSIALATAIDLDNRVDMVRPQQIELTESNQGMITATVAPETLHEPGDPAAPAAESFVPKADLISDSQAKRAFAIGKGKGFTPEQYDALLKKHNFASDREITKAAYNGIVAELERGPNAG